MRLCFFPEERRASQPLYQPWITLTLTLLLPQLKTTTPSQSRLPLPLEKKTLNRYYDKTDQSEVFRIAMSMIRFFMFYLHYSHLFLVLHPRHKLTYFENADWPDDWIKKAKEIVRAQFELSYGSFDDGSCPTSQEKVSTTNLYFPTVNETSYGRFVGQRVVILQAGNFTKYIRQFTGASTTKTCDVA